MERRTLLAAAPLAAASPLTRLLAAPGSSPPRATERRVGRADVTDLWEAAAEARRADSRYGGGNRRAAHVLTCLHRQAAPLLRGRLCDPVGRDLFSAAAELARIAAWADVDMGRHSAARHLFTQVPCAWPAPEATPG